MFNKWHAVLLISIVVQYISHLIDSNYLFKFLENNLVLLLVALLAINNTTLGVIMTKLKELSKDYIADFSKVIKQMRVSITEQLILVLAAAIIQILSGSSLQFTNNNIFIQIAQVLLTFIFLYSLYILYDTANMIFIILEFENEELNSDKKNEEK